MQWAPPRSTIAPKPNIPSVAAFPPASAAIATIVMLGLVLRAAAATRLSAHLDEASSVLAAQMVAERGVPILPSGTVYLQGATLSYALAPLVWLGFEDLPTHLTALRAVSVLAGVAAIYLTYLLAASATKDARIGAVAAFLVAVDPISVQWSAHVRMYAPLQALTLGIVLAFALILSREPSRRSVIVLIALFWIAVFTHIGAALLLLPMAVVAFVRYGRSLFHQRRDILASLVLCSLAVMTLLGLNRTLGPARAGTDDTAPLPFARFVGDHLLDLGQAVRPDFTVWQLLFSLGDASPFPNLMPTIILVCSIVLLASTLRGEQGAPSSSANGHPGRRDAAIWTLALVAFYWLPILIVVTLVNAPRERYLSHIHPLGYVIVAATAYLFLRWNAKRAWTDIWPRFGAAMGSVLPLIVLLHGAIALNALREDPIVMPNYVAALEYVKEHRDPRDVVLVTMPPPAHLVLDDTAYLQFLAGPENRPPDHSRVERYTRPSDDGQRIDYWLGVPAITSTAELGEVLAHNPGAWLVLEDEAHLHEGWALAGPMATIIEDMTSVVYRANGGALVLRVTPDGTQGTINPWFPAVGST